MKKYLFSGAAMFVLLISSLTTEAVFYTDLKLGSSGADVTALQQLLMTKGFNIPSISSGIVAHGYFGAQTRMSAIAYQKSQGLPQTGYVGPMTRARLNAENTNKAVINIMTPNGGENWQLGSDRVIQWKKSDSAIGRYVDIRLEYYYPPCTSQICPMTSTSFAPYMMPRTIAENININNLSYSWKAGYVLPIEAYGATPTNHAPTMPREAVGAGNYKIHICVTGTSDCDESDSYFSLLQKPTIEVLTPNGGENWPIRSVKNITWNNADKSRTSKVDIHLYHSCDGEYSTGCPAPFLLDRNVNSNRSYDWIVATDINDDPIPEGYYRVRVCKAGSETECDNSDQTFFIERDGGNY